MFCCCCYYSCRGRGRCNRIMDTFDAWLQLALGGSRKDVSQPGVERDQPRTYTPQHLNQTLDRYHQQYRDQPLIKPLDHSPGKPQDGRGSGGKSTVRPERGGEKKERADERPTPGPRPTPTPPSNAHYYFKVSSTTEKPNRFLDRSLPFFVPPATSR